MLDELVDTVVAAAACDRSDRWVRQAVADGRLVNHGSPRRIRVRLGEVLEVLGDPFNLR